MVLFMESTIYDMRNIRAVALFQGFYYSLTGVWPLVSMASFEAVTGPKADVWLVKMVGLLSLSIGVSILIAASRNKKATTETIVLAILSAISFSYIDIYYAWHGIISSIYYCDACIEIVLIIAYLTLTALSLFHKSNNTSKFE
jgi:hypothetical protein